MKTYSIAEILHLAADKHLATTEDQCWYNAGNKEKFSCCAVNSTLHVLWNQDRITQKQMLDMSNRIKEGLKAMGCPINSSTAFDKDEYKFNPESQQARYAWLKFAAMIAEEQGV